jgi:hypothetical protein
MACGRSLPDPKLEFFATPRSVTRALLQNEEFRGLTWEPACGHGAIAELLPGEVLASDFGDYGYGEIGVNFLKTWREVDNIVTNPPFSLKLAFKRHALECARRKVAMLFPIGTLGYELEAGTPLKAVYLFPPKTVKFVNANNGLRLAWHVWEKGFTGDIQIVNVEPVFPNRKAS